jgi:hypothetical protein
MHDEQNLNPVWDDAPDTPIALAAAAASAAFPAAVFKRKTGAGAGDSEILTGTRLREICGGKRGLNNAKVGNASCKAAVDNACEGTAPSSALPRKYRVSEFPQRHKSPKGSGL